MGLLIKLFKTLFRGKNGILEDTKNSKNVNIDIDKEIEEEDEELEINSLKVGLENSNLNSITRRR